MKFGSREICDVAFKAAANNQKLGKNIYAQYQPVFYIDTATTSSLEQASTTVYAQGGRGYNRLIAWEGEKTMTFTVTDALMSPQGLAVLTDAGIGRATDGEPVHFHVTIDTVVTESNGSYSASVSLADLQEETGLNSVNKFHVCNSIDAYATVLDGSGAGIGWYKISKDNIKGGATSDVPDTLDVVDGTDVTFTLDTKGKDNVDGADLKNNATVKLDFYLVMNGGLTEITIEPGDFGGYFYVEASTLYRREDDGTDMAAEIIIPKAKVQSAFTLTMAASGDPSTFDFTMDAFPGYTQFDKTKKVMCVMQVAGNDDPSTDTDTSHTNSAHSF